MCRLMLRSISMILLHQLSAYIQPNQTTNKLLSHQSIRHLWCTLPICSNINTVGNVNNSLRICIVGSGPSAMYTVKSLLKLSHSKQYITPINLYIHIIEKLPVVFGLVRHGVAPDHIDVKSVQNEFIELLQDKRVSLYANVTVGDNNNNNINTANADTTHHTNTISMQQLRSYYHAIVLATGALSENQLNVPGCKLNNIYTAQQFVRWYNAYPHHNNQIQFNSDILHQTDTAVVIGSGNVALDVSRMLLSPIHRFTEHNSDLVSYALHSLQSSTINTVYLLSRRGPIQSSFTIDQLRQLNDIIGIQVIVDPHDLILNESSLSELHTSRANKRKYELLQSIANNMNNNMNDTNTKKLYIKFFASPIQFNSSNDDSNNVASVTYEGTQLIGDPGSQRSISCYPAQHTTIHSGCVISAIGSINQPIHGIPFDNKLRIIPNINTRVITNAPCNGQSAIHGIYVVGWLRRGATGIIGTNIPDGKQCATAILQDMNNNMLNHPSTDIIPTVLQNRTVITLNKWMRIEQCEVEQGKVHKKHREKIHVIDELMKTALD